MKVRRKKKTGAATKLILPMLGCIFVLFIFASLFLHFLVDKPTTVLRTSENNAFKFESHHSRGEKDGSYDLHLNDVSEEDDESLTKVEISGVKASRISRPIETIDTIDNKSLPYDVHKCPSHIPKNYPYAWNILDVLQHWNPDDTEIPSIIHQGLCAIDWRDPKQREIAFHYRKNELPFLIHNHHQIWRTANRWASYDYMYERLGDKTYRNEYSKNNHMMYWKLRNNKKGPVGWNPPTENVELSFPNWYKKAEALESNPNPESAEHFYLRLNGAIGQQPSQNKNIFLFDDLPFFSPERQSDIFMVDPTDARGINCRLGSKGTTAETHYDSSRNFILMLRGQKRYILAHPSQCINMELYPLGHPSARHSRINWSDPESWLDGENFQFGMVNEVVLQAGDGLYLPQSWFHFIVSLSLNYQCNARSGQTQNYRNHITDCGF